MEKMKETKKFKTEVQQVMNLIVNSIYSNKDIFIRELISNASDAIDKIRFKAETEPEILENNSDFKIKIKIDHSKRIFKIIDNGIGMTYEEVIDNIGTIAKSGTAKFIKNIEQANKNLIPELIGQFGVGFYSSFIVSKKVELITKTAGNDSKAIKWSSHGDGEFIIEDAEKKERGTTIILYLKDKQNDDKDYTDQWVIQEIVKQHSDFVNYPIIMDMEKYEPIPDNELIKDKDGKPLGETTKKITKKETLNSMKAIWNKNINDISKEEHEEFYKHISHDWNPPLEKIHKKFEGTIEYNILLYIPSKAPFDLFNKDHKHGIKLYSKKVFIMENCKELIPEYLRFVKGVVDAPDLNLNISREILQQDKLVINIRKNIIKKIFNLLEKMPSDQFEKFYEEFGSVIKEGIHTDPENKNKIAKIIRFKTTKSKNKWVTLDKYINNMMPEQKEIFYITGENISTLINSPHIENLKDKEYEVLLMSDPVDEWLVQSLQKYNEKPLKSAEKGDLDLDKTNKTEKQEYASLFESIKKHLSEKIKEVKVSTRLKSSAACLSGDSWDMSAYMEKILKASGQKTQKSKRVLELNLNHPIIEEIKSTFEKHGEEHIKEYSQLVFDLAIIGEGGKIEDPSKLSKMIAKIITNTKKA